VTEEASEEQHRTPSWRSPSGIAAIATLVGSAAAVAALVVNSSGGSPNSSTTISGGSTGTTSELAGYWTSDGSPPIRSQTCYGGVLGICLGEPIDAVSNALGPPDDRYQNAEDEVVTSSWELPPGRVIFSTDSIDTVVEATAVGSGNFRIALPDDRNLGEFTLRDVVDFVGDPCDIAITSGEGIDVVDLAYRTGPEGTYTEEFSLVVSWEDEISESLSEGNVIDRLGDRAVTGYSVRDPTVSGVTEC
jgi:hypothetical protein